MKVGDTVQHVETGTRRIITSITPAGAMGTRISDGPTYHAALIADGGGPQHRGHTIAIWSGSLSYPTSDWKVVTP